jgi:hypothetical protein
MRSSTEYPSCRRDIPTRWAGRWLSSFARRFVLEIFYARLVAQVGGIESLCWAHDLGKKKDKKNR